MSNYNKRITTTFTSLMLDPDEGDRLAAQEEQRRLRMYDGGAPDADAAPEEDAPKLSKQERMLEKYKDDLDKFDVKGTSGIETGVVRDRSCRDVMCLIIFLAFISCMMGCTIFSIQNGNAGKLVTGYDKANHFCGYDDLVDYPMLHILKLPSEKDDDPKIFGNAVCVKECPKKKGDKFECSADFAKSEPLCKEGAKYDTTALGWYCIPRHLEGFEKEEFHKGILKMLEQNFWGQQLIQVYNCSTAVSTSLVMGIVFSLLYIYLMGAVGEYLAWAVVFLVWIGLAVLSGGSILCCVAPQTVGVPDGMQGGAWASAIVFTILFIIYNIMLYCGWKQLKLAVDCIDASAGFITQTKRLVAVNFGFFIVQAIATFLWLAAMMSLNSMGEVTANGNVDYPQSKHFKGGIGGHQKTIALFMIFGLIWILNFIAAKTTMITMTSASTFYFASKRGDTEDGEAEVGWAMGTVYKYHLGTIAFGSFCISIIQFIQLVFEAAAEQAVKASGENCVVKCMVACARWLLACLEKVVDYINRAAYSYIAVSGEGFCTGAYNGMLLNLKHGLEFAWAVTLANGLIWLGKIAIVSVNMMFGWCMMKYVMHDLDAPNANVTAPLTLILITSYVTADIFLSMFDEAVQSLMTCLLIDMDLSEDGEPQYGPQTFHDGIDKAKGKQASTKKVDSYEGVPTSNDIN